MARPLITADDVRRNRHLEVPPGAVVTPLARDLLRKRGGALLGASTRPAPPTRWVIANWKSHKTVAEARSFAAAFRSGLGSVRSGARPAVCPPFTALVPLGEALGGAAALGAQDVSAHGEGAHTGEVAARHLLDAGCSLVIVGHSERRHAGEDDATCRRKLRVALEAGLAPVLCVGETEDERAGGRTQAVVARQLEAALSGLEPVRARQVIVAYEPRWAIGTGQTPTPAGVAEVLAHVRAVLRRVLRPDAADAVSILYGGSVNERNAAELLHLPDCAGGLIGGAGLDPTRLLAILTVA